MLLSLHNIAYFLIENGLLSRDSLVNGTFLATDASRHNRNFKIATGTNGQGYFVKQVFRSDPQAAGFLRREATCYWLAQNEAEYAPLANLVPYHRLYDPARNVLIVDLLPGAENLTEYHLRVQSFPPNVAARLGQILGAYHRMPVAPRTEAAGKIWPEALPWILSIHETPAGNFSPLSPANARFIQFLQRYPELHVLLSELRDQWRVNSLIHGDMKWDNCMVSLEENDVRLRVVDWELADVGDACWDLGSIFQAYLAFWLGSMDDGVSLPVQQRVDSARYPLSVMQPALRAFWDAYRTEMRLDAFTAREKLGLSMRYGAARMIQTAYESMSSSLEMTGGAVRLLQLSFNILTRPDDACRDLLGLE